MLPLEGIFFPGRRGMDEAAEGGFLLLNALLHFPGNLAVAEVAFYAAADTGNVFGFREIHLEEKTRPGGERQQVVGGRLGEETNCVEGGFHGVLIDAGRRHRWSIEPEPGVEGLAELLAAAMPVKVAVGADVDRHVEAVLAAAEFAQEVVALAS